MSEDVGEKYSGEKTFPKDPKRAMEERLAKKRESMELLKQSVTQMKETLKNRREQNKRNRSRKDICFWMDNAILPFIKGVARQFNEPLIDGIKRLILEKKNPFKPQKSWDRTRETRYVLKRFLDSPQTKVLQTLAKPFLRNKMTWIYEEADWIREELVKEEYPDLYNVVMETPGGKEWLDDLISSFIQTMKEYLGR